MARTGHACSWDILKCVFKFGRPCSCTVCLFCCFPAEPFIACLVQIEPPKTDVDLSWCGFGAGMVRVWYGFGVFEFFFISNTVRYNGAEQFQCQFRHIDELLGLGQAAPQILQVFLRGRDGFS